MDQETLERIKEKAIEEVLKKYFGILEPREKVAMHRLLERITREHYERRTRNLLGA
jgi:hypothetical protein